MGHVGPDDNIQGTRTDIRPKKEIEQWKKKDPIKKLEKIMLTRHFAVKKELTIIKKEVAKEIEDAYLFAQNSPYPPKKELTKYVLELKTKSEKLKTKT
jgi:pyruvate dehydrogenase E1 component alpha subunit